MQTIDVNCDLGEGFGAYALGDDRLLLELVSSANIACGFHAGDPCLMRKTVNLCLDKRVAIGAHPGLPDLIGFGRREMAIAPQDAHDLVLYQIGALDAFVRAAGGTLHHVKPHGALYNMAARDERLAEAVAEATLRFRSDLVLYGLSGSRLIEAAKAKGLPYAEEAFVDRTYRADGSLMPRSDPEAVIHDEADAVEQALHIVTEGQVTAIDGAIVRMQADTLCVHGDGRHAYRLLVSLKDALARKGVILASPSPKDAAG